MHYYKCLVYTILESAFNTFLAKVAMHIIAGNTYYSACNKSIMHVPTLMYNVSKSAIGVLDTKNYIKNVKSRCCILYIFKMFINDIILKSTKDPKLLPKILIPAFLLNTYVTLNFCTFSCPLFLSGMDSPILILAFLLNTHVTLNIFCTFSSPLFLSGMDSPLVCTLYPAC